MGRVVTDKMTDKKSREDLVLEYLNKNEHITNKIVCELFSISDATAKRLLKAMVDKGLIIAEGELKKRVYKL
jgi:ATP-dependent DNA helicase RecG